MKVKLTTDRAGYGWQQFEGETHELPDAEARALLAAGQAELPPADPVTERRPEPPARKRGKQP